MGNSCVTGACRGSKKGSNVAPTPTEGGSKQVSAEAPSPAVQTTFKWKIDGFSSLLEKDNEWTMSNVFKMRGHYWYLVLDTKSGDQKEYVSLQLKLARGSVRSNMILDTTFKFFIYDQSFGKHHEHQVSHKFQKASTCSGTSCMIPLTELKENSSGFLVKNSCVFGVEFISVVTAEANDVLETLFVQKMDNTCTEPQVYTWDIEDFFALKNPSYSPEFELYGHKWSIKIYPSGDDTNGNYLSLYLVMNSALHRSSAILVENIMSIKNQENGKDLTKTGLNEYGNNCTNWGWDKFISLEDFKEASNGYLVKTKCCIEVQVGVTGSSTMK